MTGICHFVSSPGFLTGLGIFAICYGISLATVKPGAYTFEPQGRPGSFDPIIARYTRLAEVIIGLVSGSIVLLVGSSVFRSNGTKLPHEYAAPLMLLAMSAIFSLLFVALCSFNYEQWQHHNNYTHHKYRLSSSLGFAGLLCFAVGYIWLAAVLVSVT